MDIRFGPAGLGPVKTALEVLEEYGKKGIFLKWLKIHLKERRLLKNFNLVC